MWYAVRDNDAIRLFLDKNEFVLRADAVFVHGNRIAALGNGACTILDRFGRVLFKKTFVTQHPTLIRPLDDGWIAFDEDTGCVYELSAAGDLLTILRAGEHISDLCVSGENVFIATYHDNRLRLLRKGKFVIEAAFPAPPVRVLSNGKSVFVLMQNGYASILARLNEYLKEERRVSLVPQPYELFYQNRLFFCGGDLRGFTDEDLKIRFIQKSTGEILCRDASDAVFYGSKAYRCDEVSGVLYPV